MLQSRGSAAKVLCAGKDSLKHWHSSGMSHMKCNKKEVLGPACVFFLKSHDLVLHHSLCNNLRSSLGDWHLLENK